MRRLFRSILILLVMFASINATTMVASAQRGPVENEEVQVAPGEIVLVEDTLSLALAPNTTGTHSFTIHNKRLVSDSYQVYFTTTNGWLSPTSKQYYTLAPNASTKVTFNVFVPAGTPEGQYDTINVLVRSTTNTSIWKTTDFFTHALSNPPAVTPAVEFDTTTQSASEGGDIVVKVVRPTDATAGFASVNYATVDGTAISSCWERNCSTDYVAQSGRLIFYPGQSSKNIIISIIGDTLVEPSEDFTVQLSNPLNAVLGTNATSRIVILRPTVIPATTKVLDAATHNVLSGYAADGTLTFSQSTPFLDAVQPNQILISAALPVAPSGFLRRVTAVSRVNGQVVITTVQATLEEAIQDGAAAFSRKLTPADVASVTLAPGVTIPTAARGVNIDYFELKIEDKVIYDDDGNPDTKNDQITVRG